MVTLLKKITANVVVIGVACLGLIFQPAFANPDLPDFTPEEPVYGDATPTGPSIISPIAGALGSNDGAGGYTLETISDRCSTAVKLEFLSVKKTDGTPLGPAGPDIFLDINEPTRVYLSGVLTGRLLDNKQPIRILVPSKPIPNDPFVDTPYPPNKDVFQADLSVVHDYLHSGSIPYLPQKIANSIEVHFQPDPTCPYSYNNQPILLYGAAVYLVNK